jgi:hypothetical protein
VGPNTRGRPPSDALYGSADGSQSRAGQSATSLQERLLSAPHQTVCDDAKSTSSSKTLELAPRERSRQGGEFQGCLRVCRPLDLLLDDIESKRDDYLGLQKC